MPKTKNIDLGVHDYDKLVQFAKENEINLVVPGPDAPIVDGIETYFRKGTLTTCAIG